MIARNGSGRMVTHATASFRVVGSNPGALSVCSGAAAAKVSFPGFEPPTLNHALAALPFDRH